MITEKLTPYLAKSIQEYWDLPAFTDYPGPAMSYKEAGGRILWLHKLFKTCGLQKGDKVALAGKNSGNWALIWFASVTYGATIVPIMYNFSPEDTQHIINHSDARLVFISKDKFDTIDADLLKGIKYIFALDTFGMLPFKDNPATELIKPFNHITDLASLNKFTFSFNDVNDNEDIAAIIYTSGTSGFSKGVMLPHRSFIANLIYAREKLTFKVGAKMVSFLPVAHAFGFAFDLLYPFTRGTHIHFLDKLPAPKVLLGALQDMKPFVVMAVPLLVEKIYKKQLQPIVETPKMQTLLKIPGLNQIIYAKIRKKLVVAFGGNLEALVVGGAPMNAEVEAFFKKIKFPITVGYGMTECGPLVAYAHWNERKLTSSGQIVPLLTSKIESSDPVNIPGEICVKGEPVFSGYYKNDEATRETLVDGWLHTGDVGTIDKQNFVFIKGRCKNMMLGPSGENIYPESIEDKLNSLPYVLESLVIERESRLIALVYPDYEKLDNDHITEDKLPEIMENNRATLNKSLAAFAKVSKLQMAAEPFQKTPTQKIKRFLYS